MGLELAGRLMSPFLKPPPLGRVYEWSWFAVPLIFTGVEVVYVLVRFSRHGWEVGGVLCREESAKLAV